MENDILKYFKLLRYEVGICFHVGAHKFEEIEAYRVLDFKKVLWFDAIDLSPRNLPQGHTFHKCLIGEEKGEIEFYIYENATGFSSKHQLKKNLLLIGRKKNYKIISVRQNRLEYFQSISNLPLLPATLSVATQGSEYEVLLSADLGRIDQIMVRVSRNHLYNTDLGESLAVKKLLLRNGFYLNLDLTDIIFGHGYQYYSKNNSRFYYIASLTFKIKNLLHFSSSLINRFFYKYIYSKKSRMNS